jgi:hypothetical protein
MENLDLNQELALTNDEPKWNTKPLEAEQIMIFDPNFALSNMTEGFRIFAFEDALHEIPSRRSKLPGLQPTTMTVFLHARVHRSGEFEPLLEVMIKTVTDTTEANKKLSMTFDQPEITLTFSSTLLGGLLFILQTSQRDVPLLVCSSSNFSLKHWRKRDEDLKITGWIQTSSYLKRCSQP